jgi:photosystem II stability/assembly factor-like uncharacterized protein
MKYGSRAFLLLATALTALFAVTAQSAQAAVGVGQSGWSWGNPLPQGNEIDSLDFSGARGYAAGKFGTLLRSDDGGSTWSGIPTGITQDLAQVSIIDADSIAIAGGCSVRRSDDAGATFSRLPWTASDASCAAALVSLDFPVDQTGFLLLDDGSVLGTVDGGRSWSRKTALPATKATGGSAKPTDFSFQSATTGVATTDSGRIYRTTDGGNSWTLIVNAGQALNGVFFADANTGYAVGKSSTVEKTTDGGANWDSKTSGGSLNMTGIRCAVVDQCIITVDAGDRVVLVAQDPDPGTDKLTFTSVTPSSDKIFAAAFSSTTRAVAAGANGTTVISNDGGATWVPVGGRLTATFSRIRAASNTVAYVAGKNGAAAKTVDGGKSWTNIAGPTGNDVIDIAFPTPTTGYALDDANGVSRTDNGGASWQILNPGTSSPPQAIVAPSVNTVLLIGPKGVSRSSDGGGQFSRVRGRTVDRSKLFDADLAGSAIFAYGSKIILVSTNGGKTWKKVKQPKRTALASVDFTSRRIGYALSQDGRVWKTTNAGKRWKDLLSVGSDEGLSLAFSSSSKGYLVIPRFGDSSGGYLLRTNDGGSTWNPQLLSSSQIASIGAAEGTDYALAGANSLLFTNSGGSQGAASKVTIKTKRKTVKRKTSIKVTGKVSGAQQGEIALVARRYKGESGWDFATVTIAANGTFTTTWKVTKQAYFVGQFVGDADHTGDGSSVLSVKTKRR